MQFSPEQMAFLQEWQRQQYAQMQAQMQQQWLRQQAPGVQLQGGGYNEPPIPGANASALIAQPNIADMAGKGPVKWMRIPFFPTSPYYSTSEEVGYQTRYYSGGISGQTAGSEVIVSVQFDLPCRLIAINGAAALTTSAGLPVGKNSLDTFLFRLEYTTGDRLHITQRLGSTVCGTAERPGELGGVGYTIGQGASVTLGLTPLVSDLRVDITLVCLEMRGQSNFGAGPGAR